MNFSQFENFWGGTPLQEHDPPELIPAGALWCFEFPVTPCNMLTVVKFDYNECQFHRKKNKNLFTEMC
jgi:hypothetical protein